MEIDAAELIGKEPHTCEALVKKEVVLKNYFRKKDAPVSATAQKITLVFGLQRIGVASWFFVRHTNNLFLKQKWGKDRLILIKHVLSKRTRK